MAQLFYGSLDFTKLLEEAKKGNKAFSRGKNGKIYVSLNVWVNDEQDNYGNDASVQSNFKDATKEDRFYFGNLKKSENKENAPLQANDNNIPGDDDLPY